MNTTIPDAGAAWGMAAEIDGTIYTVYVRLLPKHLREEGKHPFEALLDSFPSIDSPKYEGTLMASEGKMV
jgi:hypothetical protein